MRSYVSCYRFFDTNLVFKTNYRIAHREFQKIYAYFKRSPTFSNKAIVCSLVKDGNSYRVDIKSLRYSVCYTFSCGINVDTYLGMFSPVIYEVRDYFLIHAGTLSTASNQGIIISAPCGFGKTTLTLELLKKGFTFLSDELAPINRHTGMIHPYPRGLGVLNGKEKKIIIQKNTGDSCKPSCIIFLCLPEEKEHGKTRYMELALSRLDKNVYRQLKELPEVNEITTIRDRLFPMFRLSVLEDVRIVPRIQQICRQNQVPIMYTLRGRSSKPDFNAKPKLREISSKKGIFELSRNILNSHNSALLEEVFGGSQTRMIFELAGLMNHAKFYRLTVGKLPEMTALIKNLCSGKTL